MIKQKRIRTVAQMVTTGLFFMLIFMNITLALSTANITYNGTNTLTGNFTRAQALQTNVVANDTDGETVIDWITNSGANITAPRMMAYYPFSSTAVDASNVYCYQETANVSTACGGLANGSYANGTFNTSAFNWYAYAYMNYTKPDGATNNSLWQVKTQNGSAALTQNLTIPAACWNYAADKLVLRLTSFANSWITYAECYNATAWYAVYTSSACSAGAAHSIAANTTLVWDGSYTTGVGINTNGLIYSDARAMIYEEAMYWRIPKYVNDMAISSTSNGSFLNAVNITYLPTGGINGGGAYLFNKSTALIYMDFGKTLFNTSGQQTLCAWANATAHTANDYIVGKSGAYYLRWNAGGLAEYAIYNGSAYTYIRSINPTVGGYVHFCGYFNYPTIRLYINAINVNETTMTTPYSNSTSSTVIGALNSGGGFFNGSITDVRVYNVPLNASQILDIYQSGIAGKTLNPLGLTYSTGAIWYAKATNTTSNTINSSNNATLRDYNLTLTYTTNQTDLQQYAHIATLNLSGSVTDVAASFTFQNTTYSSIKTGTYPNYQFNQTLYPLSPTNNYTANWSFNFTTSDGIFTDNYTYNISVTQAGFVACTNGTTNPIRINHTFQDSVNFTIINATYGVTVTFAGAGKVQSFSGTGTNYTLCISPNATNGTYTTTETYSNTNYYTSTVSNSNDTATTVNTIIYLAPRTTSYPTTLTITNLPNLPVSGTTINVYLYSLNTSLYQSCTTNAAGQCVVYLIPTTQLYTYSFTVDGTPYNYTELLTCDTTQGQCYRTFYIGQGAILPPTLDGNAAAACSYDNATYNLACSAAYTTSSPFYLVLYSNKQNTSVCTNTQTGTSVSLSCSVPQTNNTLYTYYVYMDDANYGGQTLTGGNVYIISTRTNEYERSGWMVTLYLTVCLAVLGAINLYLGIILAILALVVVVLLGIVPPMQIIPIIAITGVMGIIVIYKMRV